MSIHHLFLKTLSAYSLEVSKFKGNATSDWLNQMVKQIKVVFFPKVVLETKTNIFSRMVGEYGGRQITYQNVYRCQHLDSVVLSVVFSLMQGSLTGMSCACWNSTCFFLPESFFVRTVFSGISDITFCSAM